MNLRGAELLSAHARDLNNALTEAVDAATREMPLLTARVSTQVEPQRDYENVRERLFAAMVAAAMGGDPAAALPVCTASALLWAGEPEGGTRLTGTALVALRHLTSAGVRKEVRLHWTEDIVRSVASATETALVRQDRHFTDLSRKNVLADHLGVSGAAYARDAAMAARLFAPGAVEAWRGFGLLYGLIQGLARDHQESTVDQDSNPNLVVPPLLLAHAFATVAPAAAAEVARMHAGADSDPVIRSTLRDLLRSQRVVSAYQNDLRCLHVRARNQLGELGADPEYAGALQAALDDALALVMPRVREVVGL